MTDPFRQAAVWERTGETTFRGTLSERWANGPGAYGGIVAASLLHQMRRVLDAPDQKPRTLTLHMMAPVRFEPADMDVRLERRGRSISHLTATLRQAGDRVAIGSGTFGARRDGAPTLRRLDPPDVPPPDEIEALRDNPLLPEFARQSFEYRPCIGDLPMSGADEPISGGWLATDEPAEDGPVLAASLLDAWPPSVFPTFETFRRTVTADLRYQFWSAGDRSGETDAPFLFRAESEVVEDGYAEEDALLWSRDGEIVGRAKQLYAILD